MPADGDSDGVAEGLGVGEGEGEGEGAQRVYKGPEPSAYSTCGAARTTVWRMTPGGVAFVTAHTRSPVAAAHAATPLTRLSASTTAAYTTPAASRAGLLAPPSSGDAHLVLPVLASNATKATGPPVPLDDAVNTERPSGLTATTDPKEAPTYTLTLTFQRGLPVT